MQAFLLVLRPAVLRQFIQPQSVTPYLQTISQLLLEAGTMILLLPTVSQVVRVITLLLMPEEILL